MFLSLCECVASVRLQPVCALSRLTRRCDGFREGAFPGADDSQNTDVTKRSAPSGGPPAPAAVCSSSATAGSRLTQPHGSHRGLNMNLCIATRVFCICSTFEAESPACCV